MNQSRSDKRISGIAEVGDLKWGTHFCQFYQTVEEQLGILVPYLKAGLEHNEACFWVTGEDPEIETAFRKAAPFFETYFDTGQLTLLSQNEWRRMEGVCGGSIVPLLDRAICSGFEGMRIAFDADPGAQGVLARELDSVFQLNVLALVSYRRNDFNALGLMDVTKNYCFALVRNARSWSVIESAEARAVSGDLKRSEEKLQSLFNNMSEGFAHHRIVLDTNGIPCDYIFLEINNAFERLTGLTAEQVLGRRVTLALPGIENDPIDWIGIFGKVALTGAPVQFESYSELLKRWYAISAFSNQKGFFAVTFADITERKRAEQERDAAVEFLRLINEAAGLRELVQAAIDFFRRQSGCEAVGIRLHQADDFPYFETRGFSPEFVLAENSLCAPDDAGGILRDKNGHPCLECMCGNVICRRFDSKKSFFTDNGSFWTNSTTELLGSTSEADRQARTRNRCNGEGYESVALIPLRTRDQALGLIQLNDRRKGVFSSQSISMWERLADHLAIGLARSFAEEDLKAATISAERAKAAAEEANRAKDHFLAVLSHELRTPLNPALIAATILERSAELPHDMREYVSIMRRNVELEARLIDDMLDLTRIARGKLTLNRRTIDCREVLRHALDTCNAEAAEKNLSVRVSLSEEPLWVEADPARLQQVFWNLLKNSIKFTPQGGEISVTAVAERGQTLVEITDNGKGIEPEALSRIFDAFDQGGSGVTSRYGGLGLGLAICKGLIGMHEGAIRASSEGEGKGATFVVELPAPAFQEKPEPQPKTSEGRGARAAGIGARILLVEDHESTAVMTARLLHSFGHQVTTADCVKCGVETYSRETFDLVISDLGLPDGSGQDLLRQLLARGPVPAIALSGYGMEQDVRQSVESGFLEHLVKPIDPKQLEDAIDRALIHSRPTGG